ncbi:DUF4838 domain-containing protein [Prosthecobacter vanneervenii]|uniref:Alpha glucuronidase N-terminal domain-containing protein n=1 Tax=Prosthecobacter vanneervenii TaxID=48466 RepID=A0A7W8DJG4_9BACT|nr:DUF4838 domain-containing protein [Prosthecobacter vanneervenii]MBB5032118.1 hypothetical protein [Prosthecobacter vanneervenii]
MFVAIAMRHIPLITFLLSPLIIVSAKEPPAPETSELVVMDKGTVVCSLYYEPVAPKSVRLAADEIQRVIRLATGSTLPVITEAKPPMICLGDCAAARAAGVEAETMAEESFRIFTHGRAVFIVGKDTADGRTTHRGGSSRGTLFGAYAFLERVVGARWIMPGELGEIIPHHDRLKVPPLNLMEAPSFASRQLELSDPPLVRQWALRNRVGTQAGDAGALWVDSSHSWNELMPQSIRDSHPDWAAVNPYPEKPNYKFCTRNPEAAGAFAKSLLQEFDANPSRFMMSASPSDGQSFCHCDRCKAHITLNSHGKESTTRNLLDFYNDVAGQVSKAHPGRMIGALVYGANEYPPSETLQLDKHLFVEWAPLDVYGLGLYKEAYRAEFDQLAERWHRTAPNLGYSNYLHWHRSRGCAPLAPAPELMKVEFAALKKHGIESVREAVESNWAYAGPNNWLLARLMWKADADVDAMYREWLMLAYAEGGEAMGRVYALIDDAFRKFKQQVEPFHYSAGQYDIDKPKIQKIYLPLLPQIHRLCQEALAKANDRRAKQRIGLFVDNMRFFHRELRRAGYVRADEDLGFALTDEEFERLANSSETPGAPPARYFMHKAQPLPPSE